MGIEQGPPGADEKGDGVSGPIISPRRVKQLRILVIGGLFLSHLILQIGMHRSGDNPNIVFNDGVGYFSYLHSLWFDRDLNFRNEYARLVSYSPEVERVWLGNPRPDGRPGNIYAVGPAIAWVPFYFAGHAAALAGPWPADGFSFPYQFAVVLGSFLYGLAAAVLLEHLLRKHFSLNTAFAAAWSILLATPVVYYMTFEPSMAHAADFFAVTTFLVLADHVRRAGPSVRNAVFMGFAVGLLYLVRWINVVFLGWAFLTLWKARWDGKPPSGRFVFWVVLLVVGFAAGMLPQSIIWKNLYGEFFVVPGGEGYFQFNPEAFWGTLFSPHNGLYVWSPILLVATAGLFTYRGWELPERLSFFALFVGGVCVNALVHDWWGGDSFGARRFVGFFPFLAFGLAELLDRWVHKRWIFFGVLPVLIGWNGFLMIARKLNWLSS